MYKIFALVIILFPIAGHSQEVEVQGRVVNEAGKPIAGASVLIKGTPNGTVTNGEGNFKINLPHGKVILLFAFVEYKSFEQVVNINKGFNWQLEVTLANKRGRGKGSGKFVERSK